MYKIKVGEKDFEVEPSDKGISEGLINGEAYKMDLLEEEKGLHLIRDHKSYTVNLVSADYDTKTFELLVNGNKYTVEAKDRFDLLLKELGMENLAGAAVNELKAPMPGLVLSIEVKEGDEVKKGDPLLVLEAMKMENVLKAPADVVVKNITVETKMAVEKNQVLIEFEG